MANILDVITVGNLDIVVTDAAPNTGGGVNSPVGSLIIVNDGSGFWTKNSTTSTDWSQGVTTTTLSSYGVSSITGTSNRITASSSTGSVTLDISASYVGQSSITTLGTITTGTWNGSAITNAYLANTTVTVNGTSITLGGSATVTAAAGTLTGTTLNSTVVTSSLTAVGTISTGVWQGTAIANSYLANSTISGVSLGSNLFSLTLGTGLTGTSYNGSGSITAAIDTTVVVTLTGTQTLTNKSIAATQLTGTLQAGQFPALTGDITTTAGSLATTLTNASVTGQLLTGYSSTTGTISATDSILSAIGKLNANIALVSGAIVFKGLWNASTNTPTLTSGVGTTGWMYKVSVAGTTTLDGISSWNVGDQLFFDGTHWDKIDGVSTEVLSVFGRTGAVVATAGDYNTSQVTESTNLYYTNARVDAEVATYTGNVTLTGTVFTIGASQVTNSMLVNSSLTLNGTSVSLGGTYTITAAAGTLTGTTLNSTVVNSSLTSVGTIVTGVWNGTAITNSYLANSTISGVSLGGNLFTLTLGTGLTGTSYNGSAGVTAAIDTTVVVTLTGSQTLTNKTLTAPTINGGTHTAITSLGIRSTGSGAFDMTIANIENLTAGRTLTITLNDAARTLSMGGNITTAAAFVTSGANSLTLTTTGTTNVTLPTSGTLVNSSVTTLSSLSSVGTITSGVWNGTIISPTYGGTGINNGTSTITLAASLTTSGANPLTLTTTGTTNLTLPTTGTLVNTAVTTLSSLSSIGTITSGTWNGTLIGVGYGGTGTATTFTAGSIVFAGASGVYTQNNADLFWDNTNNRLGINTATPSQALHVVGTLRVDGVTGGPQYQVVGGTVNTTDNTVTTIVTVAVPTNTVLLVEARVTSRKTGGAGTGTTGDGNAYIRTVKVKNVSGTVTAGTTSSTFTDEDNTPFNCTFAVSGTNLLVQVLGANNDNVTWDATVIVTQ